METTYNNTTGSERHDLQIQQIKTTQKTVRCKKVYNRKKLKNNDLWKHIQ